MSEPVSMFAYIIDIIETVLLILERPVVWRQLIAFAMILGLAWLTKRAASRLVDWFMSQGFNKGASKAHDGNSGGEDLQGEGVQGEDLQGEDTQAEGTPAEAVQTKVIQPNKSPATKSPATKSPATQNQKDSSHSPLSEFIHKTIFRLRSIRFTILPILCIVWGQIIVMWFGWNGWLFGLLERLNGLFWLVLAYQVTVAVLHGLLSAGRAKMYNRRFVTPLFLLILFALSNDVDGGTFATRELVLFRLLDTEITIGRLLTALLTFYLFLTFAWIIRDIFETIILPRSRRASDSDVRGIGHMVVGASYYATITMGTLIGLGIAGFNMSALAVIFGGLSVGIGFGLQDLVANFVSGVLLLFGQTLRPGDVVEIGGKRGTVEKMSIRATVVQGIDNVETFVPNKTLLTSQFSTFNYTSPVSRHALSVTASYDSDPSQVRDVLVKLAERHGLVLKKPAPTVFFNNFGDSALEFELAVHLDKPTRAKEVLSDLRFMIWQEFRKLEIEIPFPQRDVYLRDKRDDHEVREGEIENMVDDQSTA